MNELPKKCFDCNRDCGAVDNPACEAVYDQDGSYWLCNPCFKKQIVIPTQELARFNKRGLQ